MPAYIYRMPAGIPGMLTRSEHATVEPQIVMTTNPPLTYGVPVAIDATALQARPFGAGDVAGNIYGFLVRSYPTNGTLINEPIGTAVPPTTGVCNIMTRGYIMANLGGTTAAKKNGAVYVRIAAAASGKPLGGVEAAADSSNTVVLPNSHYMGPADAQGNVEIAFNI